MTNTDPSQDPNNAAHPSHHRRSREEVEALAKSFVGTPAEEAAAAAKARMPMMIAAGGAAAVILAVLVYVAIPGKEAAAPAANAEQARTVAEAEQWKQRFEAERERKRKELAASSAYLERMAAADAALMNEMTARAEKLTKRAGAFAPEAAPTPREEPAKVAAAPAPAPAKAAPTTQTAAAPATTQPKATATPAPAPEQTAAKAAPAAAAPTQVAAADPKSCAIHVSELSASGKLTYADVSKMKGARVDETTGNVFTPPVKASGYQSVVFEVFPNGCVQIVRSSLRR